MVLVPLADVFVVLAYFGAVVAGLVGAILSCHLGVFSAPGIAAVVVAVQDFQVAAAVVA